MRNVFDQYDGHENRLSHALAVCLNEDRWILGGVLDWLGITPPCPASRLVVLEQSLPGDSPEAELEAEQRGLPDIVVHDDEAWALLIESKVEAALSTDQLLRHQRTLFRRGFKDAHVVILTKVGEQPGSRVRSATWSGLYEWLGQAGRDREWPQRLRNYLRVAEARLAQVGYLKEGTLTMFDGFPFSARNPYTYGEAKRVLKLALDELKKTSAVQALAGRTPSRGRPAITGSKGKSVWDFIPLSGRPQGAAFTRHPHLTLAVHTGHLEVAVTVPNGVAGDVRSTLASLGSDGLARLHADILRRAAPLLKNGATAQAYVLQRHYRSQRSPATTDARLDFNLATSLPNGRGRVKGQPAWTELMIDLLRRRRGNVQFGYVIVLPWDVPGMRSRKSLQLITAAWDALKPLLDVIGKK